MLLLSTAMERLSNVGLVVGIIVATVALMWVCWNYYRVMTVGGLVTMIIGLLSMPIAYIIWDRYTEFGAGMFFGGLFIFIFSVTGFIAEDDLR